MEQEPIIEPPLYFAPNGLHIWSPHFHPQQDVIAAPLINGHIQILKYSSDDVAPLVTVTDVHRSSCRQCKFNLSGNTLATCGQDKRLGFIDATGQVAHLIKKAHSQPINRVHFANDSLLISGDDDGMIKVWDLRSSQCVFEAQQQSQAITGILFDEQHTNVLSSSLDGSIAIYDIRQGFDSANKLYAKSDSIDEQLHGLQSMSNGKYLICPSSQQSVLIYRRDSIQIYADRIVEQPGSVQSIVKIDEDTFLTGCQDGFVRAYNLKPNKLLRAVGQHEEDQHFPVQNLALSRCRNILASTSHDNSIKFYDVSQLKQRIHSVKVEEGDLAEQPERIKMENGDSEGDFEDMSDSSDEMEEEEEPKEAKKSKNKKMTVKERETQMKKHSQRKFFQGL